MSTPNDELPQANARNQNQTRHEVEQRDAEHLEEVFQTSDVLAGLAAAFGPRTSAEAAAVRSRKLYEPGSMIAEKYRLIEQIGEGGMGFVWYAEQLAPVKRKVAIKLIKPGLDSQSVLARFEAERQALALMDHPNIARVFDGGITDLGHPFFVMELVRGTSITTWCDQNKIGLRERLELLIPVCQAIHHAHQKGVIHRDIKPSNVMVAMFDGKPVPKVIDFGVAKAFGANLTDLSLHTAFGAVVGTAEYMSPEQAQLNNLDIDTRSDVYSLGVLMYELLAGSTPFPHAELVERGWQEALRVIRDVDPLRPSIRLSTSKMRASIAALRGVEPSELGKLLRSELDWVIMKTLEKDRARRYESASALAWDLQRYLQDEPVDACPPSAAYRLRKFARRHRWPVITVALFLATMVAGIIGTSWGLLRAEANRRIAEQALKEADDRAEGERQAKLEAQRQQKLAEAAEDATLESYRASTDETLEKLISSKASLSKQEKEYLENALKRWQSFADRKGNDARSLAVRAEGHFRVGIIWETLGDLRRAAEEYERASETVDQAVLELPSEGSYRFQAGRYRRNFASTLRRDGKFAEAEKQLRAALVTSEELVDEFPDEPTYRQEMIRCLESLGIAQKSTASREESDQTLRRAVGMQEELVKRHPDVTEFRLSLATCHLNLAQNLYAVGASAAEEHYVQSLNQFEKLVAEKPSVLLHRVGFASCSEDLGRLKIRNGELKEGEKLLRRAVTALEELVDEFPTAPKYLDSLADTHHSLGWMLRDYLSDTKGAEAEYRLALELRERLVENFPSSQVYRASLAASHFTLGYILYSQAKTDDARSEYLTALRMYHELDGDIAQADQAENVGRCLWSLGDLELDARNNEQALDWFNKAIELIRPAHKLEPNLVDLRELLSNSHRGRAFVKRRLKQDNNADWDEALRLVLDDGTPRSRMNRVMLMLEAGRYEAVVPELDALVRLDKDAKGQRIWNQVDLFNFASYYATASRMIPDHADELEDQAMELLTKAVDAGFMDLPFLLRFKTLDPIRERPEFVELIERMKSQSKKE